MQSYQVFVNDHLILLTESSKESKIVLSKEEKSFRSFVEMYDVVDFDVKTIANWLLKEQESVFLVNLIHPDVEEFWSIFQACFQIIEAAGGLVRNEKEQLLMIYRLEKWDLPKGKIEKGESPGEAAIREVEEECGIHEIELKDELPSSYHIYKHKDQTILKRTYWFNMNYSKNELLVPQMEEEIKKAEWVSKDNLSTYRQHTYASLKYLL